MTYTLLLYSCLSNIQNIEIWIWLQNLNITASQSKYFRQIKDAQDSDVHPEIQSSKNIIYYYRGINLTLTIITLW